MLQKPPILVTGFEPYNGFRLNTSQVVVEYLRAAPPSSVILHTKVLPTSFTRATQEMNTSLDETNPDAVISLGLLAGISALKVERVALNIDHALSNDNDEYQPAEHVIVPGGPVAYESSLPITLIVKKLIQNGIPAYISNHAGTYVCNHVFYTTSHYIAQRQANIQCGFVHLPCLPEEVLHLAEPLPSMALDLIVRGMEYILNTVAETLRARAVAGRGS